MLALMLGENILRVVGIGGWCDLPDGRRVAPAMGGWDSGDGYRLAEIEPADPVPPGKIAVASAATVEMVDGRPKWVDVLIDAPLRFPNSDAAKSAIVAWATAATASITGPVPADEKIAWPAKEAAARAILAGEATGDQLTLVGTEANFTGEEVGALCAKIIGRADLFRSAVAAVSGIRRKAAARIDAAAPAEFEDILTDARIEAQQAAASLGLVIPG